MKLQKHTSVEDKNIFIPSSIYWGNLDQLYLPYLPYFSNCEGYDSFIPIFSILEQNSKCQHISLDETIPIEQFKFGAIPRADSCE